mmetsp:Transcript_19718/g.29899  ORF Transcript_19718/g.29899 Transcript_19718/m.29899 type:complete len:459 (-) Transcript_19718:173-1549(-)
MAKDVFGGEPKAPARKKTARLAGRRIRKKNSLMHQKFSSYISFGYQPTACLGCFFTLYALVLVCIFPMLQTTPNEIPQGPLEGAHLPGVKNERLAEAASNLRSSASKLRSQFKKWREGSGVTDRSLLHEAAADFAILRGKRHSENAALKIPQKGSDAAIKTPGLIMLGMHRSGTSMLSGLLVKGFGYSVGGPLIGAAFDNEKGFFERVDVVLQNDEFMKSQGIWWGSRVKHYDASKAYENYKSGKINFSEGAKGLEFLNDDKNAPWLQKDPRMCITLKTWLKILDKSPAIVFTYRHPMEVAMSLNKREKDFPIESGLRLWILYNMAAIKNSAGLCRVFTSNDTVLAKPLHETQRIADDLTKKCNLPPGPKRITQVQVDVFMDPNLQHNKKEMQEEKNERILETIKEGCYIREYHSEFEEGSASYERERFLYKTAMTIFCDFESGEAYKDNYQWPELPK